MSAKPKHRMCISPTSVTPQLTLEPHLVAFIDILGFGREVKAAQDSVSLARIYGKVRRIQEAFQKPSTTEDSQHEVNRRYGKRVIALSDAVIVDNNFQGGEGHLLGSADLVGWAIYEIAQAQYDCVLGHGIFLRGGIGVGPFFFENDILVSSALVDAHTLESKHAVAPIIILTETTVEWIKTTAGPDTSVPDWQNVFFRPLPTTLDGEPLFALDYLRIALTDDEPHIIFEAHREKIAAAYAATTDECVREKYRTLMRYQNETIDRLRTGELFRPYRFDMARYAPPE